MTETKVPDGIQYTKSHEWVRIDGDTVTVGITDHAQGQLTDIVFVSLPAPGRSFAAGAPVLSLESVKTVADVYAPAAGTLVEANPELGSHPELVNREPYGRGWLFRLRLAGPPPAELLDAAGYRAFLASGP